MYILNWIKKPYFFINSPKLNFILSIGVGFFIFLFLYLFQPYTISSSLNNKLTYTAGFGLITFILKAIFYVVFPSIFKEFFKNENWTVGKNLLLIISLITAITFGNFYYNLLVQNTDNMSLLSLNDFFLLTYSVAIFPIVIFTFISEKSRRLLRIKNAKKIMNHKVSTPIEKGNDEINIIGDNKKENITFNLDNLIYINSKGNYAILYLNSEKGIEEKILRVTLANIISVLNKHSSIIRCHKSYIVNSKFMTSISGNARGYFLESNLIEQQIPISRKFKKEELKNLIR